MNKTYIRLVILILSAVIYFHPAISFSTPMDVYVSIPPLKWLCDQIGSNNVKTQILVRKGQDPHTFEPTPRQIIALSQAKLFFTSGMLFEQKIADKLEAIPNHPVHINLSLHVHQLPTPTDTSIHEKDHHSQTSMKTTDHKHKSHVPHIWLSPVNLKIMAVDLAKAMIREDPLHKSEYQNNLQNLISKLDTLHLRLKNKLEPHKGATIFVFHPAFSSFTATYHLNQKAVETEGKSPTPRELAAMIAQAKTNGIKVIFVQPQFDPKSAITIASAIQGKVVSLDPLAENLETSLTFIAQSIIKALNN